MLINYFNSIKVRLEHLLNIHLNKIQVFQFHKGTIRTLFPYEKVRYYAIFQFHKGTIRTRFFRITEYRKHQFQFHKGTIRTWLPLKIMLLIPNFNSIKVRLEQITAMQPSTLL